MNKELQTAYRVAMLTLGCAKNEADSRAMKQLLEQHGFALCADASEADFIILNTCAFIESAIEESLDTVLELASLDNVRQGRARIVVSGCLPSRFGEELREELPEVDAFVPVSKEKDLAETLLELIDEDPVFSDSSEQGDSFTNDETSHMLDASSDMTPAWGTSEGIYLGSKAVTATTPSFYAPEGGAAQQVEGRLPNVSEDSAPLEQEENAPWAYVKISDGCSRRCSYCTIPAIRGSYQSYPFAQIDAEINDLVAAGTREIILVGQDTGIWSDPRRAAHLPLPESEFTEQPQNLAQLLATLATRYPTTWFRVMYLQPDGVTDELLDVIARHDNIASYLDIPLQHANEQILKSMNRRGSGAEYLKMVEHIRAMVPGVILRTTVIAGYPGESRKDSNELKDFLEAAQFDYVGIFPYSREAGTAAAELSHQVKKKTALLRVQALRDMADSIGFERAEQHVGQEVDVLICGYDEEGVYARTQGQAPEVDGITYIHNPDYEQEDHEKNPALQPGMLIRARITEAILYDLYAEVR